MITQTELKEILEYNPETGDFIWKKNYHNMRKGAKAESTINSNGKIYHRIKLKQVTYKSSRLAWLYMTGEFPDCLIDHIDTDTLNDKWDNLRLASNVENSCNSPKPKNNTSGIKGLSFVIMHGYEYIFAQITYKKQTYRKYFKPHQLEEAKTWIRELREELHGEFANHG
jgi:hypothetical protein